MNKTLFLSFLIILIHLHLSKATSSKVNGGNYKACGGAGATAAALEDCLIGNDLEEEFSFGSHAAARMLYDVSQSVVGKTGNSNGAASNCPHSQGYRSCLPSSNGGDPRQNCGDYTRIC